MPRGKVTLKDGKVTRVGNYALNSKYKAGNEEHTIEGFTKGGNALLRGTDGVLRMEKMQDDRLNVRVVIEFTGNLRRADIDRFTQAMSKTVAFEFENGGGGM